MKPTFCIKRKGAQNERSASFDSFLTNDILEDICFRLTRQKDFNVKWVEERNVGRLITLETDRENFYITLSPYGVVQSRNSYFQSVPTAFSIFINAPLDSPKKRTFCFYFLPCAGDNKTRYMRFLYRVLSTIGVKYINPDKGISGIIYSPFQTVNEIINMRNANRGHNQTNQSTYITNEGRAYHIYGKTFGANQKETALLCMAICRVSNKPVILYQILDNDSRALSQRDVSAIEKYVQLWETKPIKILDDTCEIVEQEECETTAPKEVSLRDPRFIYNLLEKTHGHKRCVLCSCEIDSIIQGAHIYPVAEIKKRKDLTLDQQILLATDKDNGLWMCENHHKLFDRALIHFVDGKIVYNGLLDSESIKFIDKITTDQELNKKIYNEHMQEFFTLRDLVYADLY